MARIIQRIRNLPIRHKLTLTFVGTCVIILIINAGIFIWLGWQSGKTRIQHDLSATAGIFSENIAAALSFNDETAARSLLNSLKTIPEIRRACVYRKSAEEQLLFTDYHIDNSTGKLTIAPCPDVLPPEAASDSTRYINLISPIHFDGELIGYIDFRRSTHDLSASTLTTARSVAIVLLLSTFLAYLFTAFFRQLIESPIQDLVRVTKQVAEENDFSIRAEKQADDEIGRLFDSFNGMLSQVQLRDVELLHTHNELKNRVRETEASNTKINRTLAQLRETQEQLVQQEKMASLGGLVAGVAHEINTPLGVGVTAASTLQAASEETASLYSAGKLTNSGLKKYINTATQSSTIILKNLNRAADLIQSFKQVAVDQASSEIRRFNLAEYLDEILLSLRPQLKKTAITVHLDINKELEITSYPGALSQIITNLVINSLIHAFSDNHEGDINIAVSVNDEDQEVELRYTDNGCGMDEEALHRIFDPFFTTRRGNGGSGLGMHIVYNLVTQQLLGRIRIDSSPGAGMTATLNFPLMLTATGEKA